MFEYQGNKDLNRDYFYIDWQVGTQCNYKCSYCLQKETNKNGFYPSLEDITKAISVINSLGHKEVEISISGGETTLFPQLQEMVELICENVNNLKRLTVLTNGFKNLSYYEKLIIDNRFVLYWSVHPEFIFNLNKFKEQVVELSKLTNLQLALMYLQSEKIDSLITLIDQLFDESFWPKLVFLREAPFFEEIKSIYSPKQIEKCIELNKKWSKTAPFEKNNIIWKPNNLENLEHNYALINNYLNFQNLWCLHGFNSLWIRYDGICRGSICRNAINSKFSIYDGVNPYILKDYLTFIKCKSVNCGCKDNLHIPKFKKLSQAKEFLEKRK